MEALGGPAAGLALEHEPVVQPVRATLPELDPQGIETIASPERRQRHLPSREALLDLAGAALQFVAARERLALQ
jgi:hypothetical protein